MLSDRLSLKLNSVLRRAGLADVSRPVLAGVCLLCIVLVVVALWRFWPAASARSEDFAVQASSAQQEQQDVQEGGTSEAEIYVDVEGAVESPGMYALPADARIADAVSAAGGLTESASRQGVNLAQKLEDGMQVYVPSEAEQGASSASGSQAAGGSAEAAGAKISLNTASAEELQELDGIGPSLSQRIIDYRTEHGRFSSIEELKEVSGIGDVRFEALKDDVCL